MKKFMAMLATGLVMALSATSVFAAGSAEDTVTVTTPDGVVVEVEEIVFDGTQVNDSVEAVVDVVTADLPSNEKISKITVVKMVEISEPEDWDGKPITLTIKVPGLKKGDNVVVSYYDEENDKWDVCTDAKVVKNGVVKATFKHFCPVLIATYETEETTPGSWYYDPEIDGPVDPSVAGTTSPKTGVLPVAAIAAGICLAGAAVCGKKVK